MKNFFKKCLVIITIFLATSTLVTPTYATDKFEFSEEIPETTQTITTSTTSDCRYFLGIPAWDCGVESNWNESNLSHNIWAIVTNISVAITSIAAYLIVGYIIYGGYLYMLSSGDPGKAMSGKKTLTHAIIGLAVTILAKIIVSSISIALTGSSSDFSQNCLQAGGCGVTETQLIQNLINWVIGIAGTVSVIFVIIGGVGYITSSGDPGKLQKAKTTILYSLIGLTIVGLSLAIDHFVFDIIDASNSGQDIREPVINMVNTIIGIIGVVAVIFIIKGGVGYMTSIGDAGKTKKAKDTILYACIGLIIVALAFAIVNFAIAKI